MLGRADEANLPDWLKSDQPGWLRSDDLGSTHTSGTPRIGDLAAIASFGIGVICRGELMDGGRLGGLANASMRTQDKKVHLAVLLCHRSTTGPRTASG